MRIFLLCSRFLIGFADSTLEARSTAQYRTYGLINAFDALSVQYSSPPLVPKPPLPVFPTDVMLLERMK